MHSIVALLHKHPVVQSLQIQELVDEPEIQVLHARVTLVDTSILFIREAITEKGTKYSYHWQRASGELIRRWDNAPHWQHQIKSLHHVHINRQDNVERSRQVAVKDILGTIAALIKDKNDTRSLTLVELMTVFVIVALLVGASLAVFNRARRKAKETKARHEIEQIEAILQMYAQDWGFYPVDDADPFTCQRLIRAIEANPSKTDDPLSGYGYKPYAEFPEDNKDSDYNLLDPWGRPYGYLSNTADSSLFSPGGAGTPGFQGEERGLMFNLWSVGHTGVFDDYITNW